MAIESNKMSLGTAILGIILCLFYSAIIGHAILLSNGIYVDQMIQLFLILGSHLSVMLWLTGSYLWQKDQIGKTGLTGYLIGMLCMFVIGYWIYISDGTNTQQTFALWNSLALPFSIWGMLMFGTACLRVGWFPRMAIVLWMTGFLIGGTQGHIWPGRILMVSVGLLWCSYDSLKNKRALRSEPLPSSLALEKDNRLVSLDIHRGLIIILMAIDHASAMIRKIHPFEFWNYPVTDYFGDTLAFLTRFVTHFCAPGFFFLMGAGIILFTQSRMKHGWSIGRVMKAIAIRGLLIIILEKIIWNPNLYGSLGLTKFSVLFGLGGALMVSALLIRSNKTILLIMGLSVIAVTQILPQSMVKLGIFGAPAVSLFLVPYQSGNMINLYPVLPWAGITWLGMVFGKELLMDRQKAFLKLFYSGLVCLALFTLLRWAGNFGNFHQPSDSGLIAFFNVVKYPPSLVFTLLTIGVNAVILFLIEKFHHLFSILTPPLIVFGKTALYFYFAHWFLFFGLGMPFYFIKTNFLWMYGAWLTGLCMLYPVCREYLLFKMQTQPDSAWRFI